MLIIFNLLGAIFVAIGFIPGFIISTVFGQEGCGLFVTAVTCAMIDYHYRERHSEEEGHMWKSEHGGSFFYAPLWAWGGFFALLALVGVLSGNMH
jgi:hypothetical protein